MSDQHRAGDSTKNEVKYFIERHSVTVLNSLWENRPTVSLPKPSQVFGALVLSLFGLMLVLYGSGTIQSSTSADATTSTATTAFSANFQLEPHDLTAAVNAKLAAATSAAQAAALNEYVVQPEQYVSLIAMAMPDETSRSLCELNKLADCNMVHVGQKLAYHGPLNEVPAPPAPTATTPPATPETTTAAASTPAPEQQLENNHDWTGVQKCESAGNGDWAANTGNGFEGGLQFTPSTWEAFGGTSFTAHAYEATAAQQIHVAEQVLKGQGIGAWPVCGQNIKDGTTPLPDAPAPAPAPAPELPATPEAPPAAAPAPLNDLSGDAATLAQKILDHPNTSFQLPEQRVAMQHIAETGHATTCGSPAVSANLLRSILDLADEFQIVIGVVVDGHLCDGLNHPKGLAADVNGVNALDGSAGTGTQLHFLSQDMPIIEQFYQRAGEVLAANGGGGLGQEYCFNGPAPEVPGVSYFDDECSHLHMSANS